MGINAITEWVEHGFQAIRTNNKKEVRNAVEALRFQHAYLGDVEFTRQAFLSSAERKFGLR